MGIEKQPRDRSGRFGRKATSETFEQILEALERGYPKEGACRAVGISRWTLQRCCAADAELAARVGEAYRVGREAASRERHVLRQINRRRARLDKRRRPKRHPILRTLVRPPLSYGPE